MNKQLTLEDKINNILIKDFVLDGDYESYYRESKFVHKSGKVYINILIQNNGEQDIITSILLYKKGQVYKTSFSMSEKYSFSLREKQEVALRKLESIKTKVCLTQIFQ